MKYQKKPIIIDAFQLGVDEEPQWWINAKLQKQVKVKQTIYYDRELTIATIKTLEGKMRAQTGDYIIRGVKGELYPCKEDIFKETYEEVKADNEKE